MAQNGNLIAWRKDKFGIILHTLHQEKLQMDRDGNVQKETMQVPEEKEIPLKTGNGGDFPNYDSKFRSNEEKTDTFNIKNKTNVCIMK